MAAPLADERTRLDAAVDAAVAVALVADELGDRAGVLAFDREVRRRLAPRRARRPRGRARAASTSSRAPTADYELAFRSVERRQARVRGRLHRPPRGGRRAAAGGGRAGALAPARGRDRDRARPGPRRGRSRPSRPARTTSGGGRGARRAATRARAWRHMLRRAGADVVEAPADRFAAACVGAYLRAKARGRAVIRLALARTTSAQYGAAAARPTATAAASGRPRGVTKPSTSPASTSHGIVPSTISIAATRRAPQRRAARQRPGVDDRPADPQPGGAADGDAGQLEQAVREHEPQQLGGGAVLDREPEQRADEAAVEERHRRAAEPEQDAAGDHQERDPDVVREDLARERRLFAGRQVAGATAGVGRVPELGRDDAERRRRVVDGPHGRERHRHEQQGEPEGERERALAHAAPVPRRQERTDERRRGSVAYTLWRASVTSRSSLRVTGSPGNSAAGERKVGGRRAVAPAEPQQRVGAEPLGPAAGAAHECGELVPSRGPLACEAIDVHRREGV